MTPTELMLWAAAIILATIAAAIVVVVFASVHQTLRKKGFSAQIRSNHPYTYRCGRWATIRDIRMSSKRACYVVAWEDGKTDLWPVEDGAAKYEFRAAE